jgi:hypothetical protein
MTLASFETTRTMTFVRIFSAEKDGWTKEIKRKITVKKNGVIFDLAPFIFHLTFSLSPTGRGKYPLL